MSGSHSKVSSQTPPGLSVDDYHYELPGSLIAQVPTNERGASRLLCVDGQSGAVQDLQFAEIRELLRPSDLLVVNDTRVLPARMYGRKASGGRVEVMLERLTEDGGAIVQIKASKPPRPGTQIILEEAELTVQVEQRSGEFYSLVFPPEHPAVSVFTRFGQTPLPPYIRRPPNPNDNRRYQTVYAREPGAVAAPTAGLHFDEQMLQQIRAMGVVIAYVTLHVAAGTFQPLRVNDIRDHQIHSEYLRVPQTVCDAIKAARQRGGRIVAVGTTVVRALETAAASGQLDSFNGETRLFIYPGFRFRVVDAMLTNFHLPGSSLLMLVCAFAGRTNTLRAYQHAVRERYRFYSYGDAMWLTPDGSST